MKIPPQTVSADGLILQRTCLRVASAGQKLNGDHGSYKVRFTRSRSGCSMAADTKRTKLLRELLAERILVLDGAFGTFILDHHLSAADYGGTSLEGCNENVVRTRPDLIRAMHAGFLEAGADLIETASFGSTRVVLAEYGLEAHAQELNRMAATIAREEAERYSTPAKPRFVVGSMGPTTKSISVTGGIGFDALAEAYREQALGLIEGGVDVLLIETVQDTLNCKAALIGIDRAIEESGHTPAVAVSGTIETMVPSSPARMSRRFTPRWRIATCSGWGLTAQPGRIS